MTKKFHELLTIHHVDLIHYNSADNKEKLKIIYRIMKEEEEISKLLLKGIFIDFDSRLDNDPMWGGKKKISWFTETCLKWWEFLEKELSSDISDLKKLELVEEWHSKITKIIKKVLESFPEYVSKDNLKCLDIFSLFYWELTDLNFPNKNEKVRKLFLDYCDNNGCFNQKEKEWSYCYDHWWVCRKDSCKIMISITKDCCPDHQDHYCNKEGCLTKISNESSYCCNHMSQYIRCCEDSCSVWVSILEDYCLDHRNACSSCFYRIPSYQSYCSTCESRIKKETEQNNLKSLVRQKTSLSNPQEVIRFETWWNKNLGTVIDGDYSYTLWLVVYEPAQRSMNEILEKFEISVGYDKYSLDSAKSKAKSLRRELNGESPILSVHPNANSYESFNSIITNPYVERREIGNANVNNYIFFMNGSGTTPSNLDNYFKPLDIVKIREAHKVFEEVISGITYYHFGIYLGDVGNGDRICSFTKENNGVRLTDWEGFLKNRIGELYRYHPVIPFKYTQGIAKQIAWAYYNNFLEGQYNLRNRNCEHFANMCVYGINYSEQMEDNKEILAAVVGVPGTVVAGTYAVAGVANVAASFALAGPTFGLSLLWGVASAGLAGVGTVATAAACYDLSEVNNGKGSTIKLVSEISASNGKLGERDNWLSDRIKANIEVPVKEPCRIM